MGDLAPTERFAADDHGPRAGDGRERKVSERRAVALALGMLVLLGASHVGAAEPRPGENAATAPGTEPAPSEAAAVVTLTAFLDRVLAAHPTARAADLERDLGAAELLAAKGAFDPVLRSKTDFKQKDDRSKADRTDTVIEQPLPWLFGPRVYAGYRRNVGTNVDPEEVTPEDGESRVGVALSLLQGVRTDRRRAALSKAELRPELAEAVRRLEINNLVRAAAVEYSKWAEATEIVAIQEELLALASTRATFVDGRVAEGESAPIEAVEATQELARREGDVVQARRALEQAAIDASVFLWTGDGAPRPLEGLPEAVPAPAAVERERIAAERAETERRRPEIARARLALASAEIDAALADELWWPSVEAFAESIQPDLGSPDGDEFKVGFSVTHPLWFRQPNAQRAVARVNAHRAWLQQLTARRTVEADVERAIVGLERTLERHGTVEREAALARRLAEAERERFDAGDSSLLVVNIRERAAAEAATRLVNATAEYLRAVIAYRWAVGTVADWSS
jgi:outer membrane protein TolC